MKKLSVSVFIIIILSCMYLTACNVKYTVTFNVDGELYVQMEVESNEKITLPSEPQKEGYTFDGWFLDNDEWQKPFTQDYFQSNKIKDNLTIYAKWSINIYTVSFKINDEIISTQTYTVENKNITEPEIPIKEFYNGKWEDYELDFRDKIVNAEYTPTEYIVEFIVDGEVIVTAPYTIENTEIVIPKVPDKEDLEGEWSEFVLDGGNKLVTALYTTKNATDGLKYNISGDSVSVIGYEGDDREIIVPSIYRNKEVIAINSGIFSGCSNLEKITLPFVGGSKNSQIASASTLFGYIFGTQSFGGSTEIQQYYEQGYSGSTNFAIYYIPTKLSEVIIKDGNFRFGAFYACNMIKSVTLPNGLVRIADQTFRECSSLEIVHFPDSLNVIGDSAFFCCDGLVNVSIPDSVTEIEKTAFMACSNLKEVTFGQNVSKLGAGAFEQCSSLDKIIFTDNLTHIEDRAFGSCNSLVEISLPNNITYMGISIFSGCSSLERIDLPNSLTKIPEGMFSGCRSLSEVTIPDGVTIIDMMAFMECRGLQKITIPNSVICLEYNALANCYGLKDINYDGSKEQWWSIIRADWNWNTRGYTIHCSDGDIKYGDYPN